MDDFDTQLQTEDVYADAEDTLRSEWEAEQYQAQWDDDPNPYHGDYSEE